MGGIGETTLADSVFNIISRKFPAHYFLQNVHEKFDRQGMEHLRDDLLSKLFKENIHIDTWSIGPLIQDRLRNIRAFVVFDDVSRFDQIKHLGVAEYLGPQSKIIVTSRDQQVLKNIGVDEVFKVESLKYDESLQLFCKYAFKQYNPVAEFRDLSMKFVRYAGGNPLALKVLGLALYQKSGDLWGSAWDKLEEYPEQEVMNVLKISFNGLDRLEKDIFLDIACLYPDSTKKDFLPSSLECCYKGKGVQITLSNLVGKCLVEGKDSYDYSYNNMHDLLRQMGRDIARQESEDPERRSRLWSSEDVCNVLKYKKGTKSTKAMFLEMKDMEPLQVCPDIFEKMINLIFIRFINSSMKWPKNKLLLVNQDIYLPNGLRYFEWHGFPSKSLPSNFSPTNLVSLYLRNSDIEQLWNEDQEFVAVNLRWMDLSFCSNLRKIPNLLGALKLETLYCGWCWCKSLVELPCMKHLTSLKSLSLKGCSSLTKFSEFPPNLEELDLNGTQIEEVPSFIGSIKKLRRLDLGNTKIENVPSSIVKLDALEDLCLNECHNIIELNLNTSPIEQVSSSISGLQKSLRKLDVGYCESLKSLSNLPPWLHLNADGCISLERVSFIDHDYQGQFKSSASFRDCLNLNGDARNNIIGAYPMTQIQSIAKQSAKELTQMKLDVFGVEDFRIVEFCLPPRSEIPDKFENQSRNSSICVKLDFASNSNTRFLCFALSIMVGLNKPSFNGHIDRNDGDCQIEYQLKGTDGGSQIFNRKWYYLWNRSLIPSAKHEFILFRGDMVHRDLNYKEACFDFQLLGDKKLKLEKCGVHVFYVDAESFTVSHVDSGINFSCDEDKICTPKIIQSNSSPAPTQLPQEFALDHGEFYVDAESFNDVEYSSFESESNSSYSPSSPDWLSEIFDGSDDDFGESMIEEDANVEDPVTTVSALGSTDDEGDHQPHKRVKRCNFF